MNTEDAETIEALGRFKAALAKLNIKRPSLGFTHAGIINGQLTLGVSVDQEEFQKMNHNLQAYREKQGVLRKKEVSRLEPDERALVDSVDDYVRKGILHMNEDGTLLNPFEKLLEDLKIRDRPSIWFEEEAGRLKAWWRLGNTGIKPLIIMQAKEKHELKDPTEKLDETETTLGKSRMFEHRF